MKAEISVERPLGRSNAAEVFAEMFELLEDYAPAWYSEDLHDRALAALRHLKRLNEN